MKSFAEFITEQIEKIKNKKSVAYGSKVDTSPTPEKIKSGGYKKFHMRKDGLAISIENPLGSTRSGTDPDGTSWSTTMKADYGYFKNSMGFDKDHVDVFVKPGYKEGNTIMHIVNQYDSKGKFDEHKCIMGAKNSKEAMTIYKSNYDVGWTGGKDVVEMSIKDFKKWIKSKEPKKGPAKTSIKTFSELHRR